MPYNTPFWDFSLQKYYFFSIYTNIFNIFCNFVFAAQIAGKYIMQTELDQVLLEAARGYLKSLNDEQFLAMTCDLTNLHNRLIRLVHTEALIRQFRAPIRVTADFFMLTKSSVIKNLRKK